MRLSARMGLLPIVLGAFALRLYHLGLESLWYDETVSLYLARQDLASLTRHTAGDIHPPLYYYLLHFWGQLAGWSEFAAAWFSLFFGIVLLALVYRVAWEWFNARVALRVALLVAISPFNLWYSQEVRMYTLGATLGLASVFFFVRVLKEIAGSDAGVEVGSLPIRLRTPSRAGHLVTPAGSRGVGDLSEAKGLEGAETGAHHYMRLLRISRGCFPQTAHQILREQVHDSAQNDTEPDSAKALGLTSRGLSFRVSRFALFVSWNLLAYVAVSALGLYTLYYFVFLLLFENLVALLYLVKSGKPGGGIPTSALQAWFFAQLGILLLYLPWLPIAFWQAVNPPVPPWRSFTDLGTVLEQSFTALALGQSVKPSELPAGLVIVLVALVAGYGIGWGRRPGEQLKGPWRALAGGRWAGYFLSAFTFIPMLAIFAFSLWKPLWHVRYLFIYSPGFYLLLALGLERIWRSKAGRAQVAGGLLLLGAVSAYSDYNFWFNPQYATDDLRGAVQHLAEEWRPGDAILVDAGYTYTALAYYYPLPIAWRGRLKDYAPHEAQSGAVVVQTGTIGGAASLGWGNPESDFYPTTTAETRAALDRLFVAHPRVWLLRLYDTVVDPNGVIRDYLAQHGRLIEDQVFQGDSNMRVQGYLTTRTPLQELPAGTAVRGVLLGKRIELLGVAPAAVTVRAGASFDATLFWRAQEPTNVDERLYLGLYSASGELVASTIEQPLGNALGTTRWSADEILREPVRMSLPSLAPGRYVLRGSLYDPFTNEPLAASPGPYAAADGLVLLTEVTVQ